MTSGSDLSHDHVANIGNLILVEDALNTKLKDKDFLAKKSQLAGGAGVWIDETLKKSKLWTGTEIDRRAKLLAKVARDKVWRI